MAYNKENRPFDYESSPQLADGSLTPPGNIPGALGIRHWQHAAYASPPFGLLSPNSKPSLARQRDHSACRRADSPLKVRKTRENLKHASVQGDVVPPCLHEGPHDTPVVAMPPILSFTSATTIESHRDSFYAHESDINGSTLVSYDPQGPAGVPTSSAMASSVPAPSPSYIPSKISRHKSMSRRMLSRVKEGITHRSRSSQSVRGAENENSLIRKLSGKRKQSGDGRRAMQSFEISRDSIDSIDSHPDDDGYASNSQRSFTDSSVMTDERMATGMTLTPPSDLRSRSLQASSRLLSTSPALRTPTGDPTPRPTAVRDSVLSLDGERLDLQVAIPYVDVKVSIDRDTVDVGISREIWVSVEATVRSRLLEARSSDSIKPTVMRQRPIDAVILVCQKSLAAHAPLVRQCVVELCSRLDHFGDRLAVMMVSTQQLNASTVNCEGIEIHALQAPRISTLLGKLGFTSTSRRYTLGDGSSYLPFRTALQAISEQGLRQDIVQSFIVAADPNSLARAVEDSFQWPAHSIRIGTETMQSPTIAIAASKGWRLHVPGDSDLRGPVFDNMFSDMRNGVGLGNIPSLRLCYKTMEGCRVLDVIGDKAVKDLKFGQTCHLFLKLQVPKIHIEATTKTDTDHDSLFTELESIVGTLNTNIVHVEARYRHTALPAESIVTVRQICSIRRPQTESRWSLVASASDHLPLNEVHLKLARYLSANIEASKAVKLIDRWNLATLWQVQELRNVLAAKLESEQIAHDAFRSPSPAVIVTDIETNTTHHPTEYPPSVPQEPTRTASAATLTVTHTRAKLPNSLSSSTIIPTRTISAPKATTAISISPGTTQGSRESTPSDANDTARQLWHHLRRNSLSAKQMLEMSPEKLQQIEDGDEALRTLRHQALANKRSIGAETLKAWQWEGEKSGCGGEAPWL